LHPDDLLCGGSKSCPTNYFCGKGKENPNYGITSFDNIFYALLLIF